MEFPLRNAILSLLLAGCALLPAASALKLGGNGEVEMRGFRTDGVCALKSSGNEKGGGDEASWEIRGGKAMMKQDSCRISGFEMTVVSRRHGTFHITSPQCEFNTAARTVRSGAALNLEGRGMEVSGNGYDLYWSEEENRFTVVIRDAVRITLDRLALPEKNNLRK